MEKKKIEILPSPKGYFIIFPFRGKNAKKKIEEIREAVMADLLKHKYLPKSKGVEWRGGRYCFEVMVKEERPELLEDLKQALSRALEKERERAY